MLTKKLSGRIVTRGGILLNLVRAKTDQDMVYMIMFIVIDITMNTRAQHSTRPRSA